MLKCPHCKGLLALTPLGTGLSGQAPEDNTERLLQWLNEPVPLSDLLLDYGCNGDLSRFEPLDRMVVRTVFRTVDAVRALDLGIPPEQFRYTVARLPGWSSETVLKRLLGTQGRWWVKAGYEWTPGFVEPEDDLV